MAATVEASPLFSKYAEPVDRESAREKLAARLEAGAAKAQAEQEAAQDKAQAAPKDPAAAKKAPTRRKAEKSVVEEVVSSTAFRQVMRTAAREIVRGVFKTGRR